MSLIQTLPDIYTPTANWCRTENKVIKHKFVWTIQNFSFRLEKLGEAITSSTFSIVNNDKWCVKVYPKGYSEAYQRFVSVSLVVESMKADNVRGKTRISMLNNRGENAFVTTLNEVTGVFSIIKQDVLLKCLLPEDNLTIVYEIFIVSDSVNVSGEGSIAKIKVPETKLSLGHVLNGGKFTDVTIVVDGCEIPAHKAILAGRSDYFAAMFESEMEESIQNRVQITDFEHEVVKELLYFIYTDTAPNLDKMADELLAAADKYSLEKLKAMCEKALCSKISVEKAAKILVLSDLHRAEQLKVQTMNFVIAHLDDVLQSQGFQDMCQTHLDIIKQLFGAHLDIIKQLFGAISEKMNQIE